VTPPILDPPAVTPPVEGGSAGRVAQSVGGAGRRVTVCDWRPVRYAEWCAL